MIEIRSYRAVFDLERRIYRVDQLRLNPGGIPVRGVVYFLAILLATLIAGSLPVVGAAIGALPWYLRDLALPAASATVLSVIRIEGRPFHLAAYALLRYGVGPRTLLGVVRPCGAPGERWYPQEVLMLPDGSDGAMRRLRYTGPGAVLITAAHERVEGRGPLGGARLTLRELPGGQGSGQRPGDRAGPGCATGCARLRPVGREGGEAADRVRVRQLRVRRLARRRLGRVRGGERVI